MSYDDLIKATALTGKRRAASQQVDGEKPALGSIEVLQKLEARGYREFDTVSYEGNIYAVTATDPDGNRVDILVDGSTGHILRAQDNDPS